MATIRLHLSRRVTNDKAEVMARFCAGRGLVFRAHTRVFVLVSMWDEATERMVIPRRGNIFHAREAADSMQVLEELRSFVLTEYMSSMGEVRRGWLQKTIDKYHGLSNKDADKPLSEVSAMYAVASGMMQSTAKQHRAVMSVWGKFEKKVRHDFLITEVTRDDLDEFVSFMRKGGVAQNTINTRMRKLRAVFNWWSERYDNFNNPFIKYAIKQDVYQQPYSLTAEECALLLNTTMPTEHLAIQRDIFIFQCSIGCRVSDLMALTTDNVQDGYIEYMPRKTEKETAVVVRVPLTQTARDIIDRRNDGKRLLPCTNNCQYNIDIKKILQAADITRMVIVMEHGKPVSRPICEVASSHLARRTFTDNIFHNTKSKEISTSLTGHSSDSKSFARYHHVDDSIKQEAIKAVDYGTKK